MSSYKSMPDRALDVALDYAAADRNMTAADRYDVLVDLVLKALRYAEASGFDRAKRSARNNAPRPARGEFPFHGHRTLAQVDQAKEPA